jgi:CRISPR type III-A-associated RAMP protein Csm4
MQPAVLIRLRPAGPWRFGPGDGGHDRLDGLYRSDRLYSAVTLAMRQLGWLEAWLEATARRESSAVAFSSLFPFQGDTLFAPPPATLWPPPATLVNASSPVFLSKIRWSAARFVPLGVIESMLRGQSILADQWLPDAESGCLLRRDRPSSSPFRAVTISRAAVDRVTSAAVHPHSCAAVEFEAGSGLWILARYADAAAHAEWNDRLIGAFRLLADSGLGGHRSSGWGRASEPEFQQGAWPALLFPKLARARNGNQQDNADGASFWLLSLYSPAASDAVDWSQGDYRATLRGGHIENGAALPVQKKNVRMVMEGSVIVARTEPLGAAVDVAPEGFGHPVYRCGTALAFRLPEAGPAAAEPVETPHGEEAPEEKPCPQEPPPPPEVEPLPQAAPSEEERDDL